MILKYQHNNIRTPYIHCFIEKKNVLIFQKTSLELNFIN